MTERLNPKPPKATPDGNPVFFVFVLCLRLTRQLSLCPPPASRFRLVSAAHKDHPSRLTIYTLSPDTSTLNLEP